ncbi:O-antigen ligase [Porticoccaceae bacterium]|nr:O-antigen ligase [Porticoccaceae bacterium]
MSFLFISLLILFSVMTILLLQGAGFSILRVGIVQFVAVSLFFFSFLGALPLFFGWDEYRVNIGVDDQVLILKVMLFSGFTMVLFIIGAMSAKTVFSAPSTLNNFNQITLNKKESLTLFFLLLFVLVIVALYLSNISRVALLVTLLEGAQESASARSSMGNNFSGNYHWYSVVIHDLANIITFSFFAAYLLAKEKIYLTLFTFSFLVSSFTALMAVEKAPFVWLLVGLFMVYVAVRGRGFYPVRKVIIFFTAIIGILVLAYVYFMGVSDVSNALSSIFSRAFAGSIMPAYYYLDFFPTHHDFLLGTSFPNPGGILPYQPYALSKEVMNWVNPSLIEEGIVGSMPTVFWGEAYANFGYAGLILIPFLVGFLVYVVDIFVSKLADTPLKIGFYVWTILHYKNLAITGFSGFIIDFHMVLMVFMLLGVLAISNKFRIKTRINNLHISLTDL